MLLTTIDLLESNDRVPVELGTIALYLCHRERDTFNIASRCWSKWANRAVCPP
jgi:hypothetical protein